MAWLSWLPENCSTLPFVSCSVSHVPCFSFVCFQGIADLNMFSKPAVLGALAHFILNAYVAMVGLPLALFASSRTILLNDAFQCSLSALSLLIYSALHKIGLDRFLVFDSRNPIMSRMKTH